ncbi:hypothetical protein QAD02_014268 [Eretmocerus hayati]|uniref:Uncharacterized protein n=1 Tax=Eretmocerus hayati TaxID=131215 RepID=A0ACC2P635_9HYME|nr:hypothetical protein QAD02_014268 [Eretmocerus hayati]
MTSEKKVNVHYSSLVGLKAELLRKQAEIEKKKSEYERANLTDEVKFKVKKLEDEDKKKGSNKSKASKELEDSQSKRALEKSKLMLKAKSRLYDELTKTHVNMNPHFLVDFEGKPDDTDVPGVINHEYSDSDEEWVEYTDCLGRTRKCLREDLPRMLEEDNGLKKSIKRENDQDCSEVEPEKNETYVKEPEIEMMRRKWEEQTAKLAHKTNIHYQDVLFDEARSHGVGYYAFSQDEEERAKQQENLLKLRKETEQKQKEIQQVQEMKDRMNKNRLRAARLRQKMRAGLADEENQETNRLEGNNEDTVHHQDDKPTDGSHIGTVPACIDHGLKEDQSELDTENKIEAFGKLLGKRNQWYVMSQDEWIQKKRKERQEEFAPAYENFVSSGYGNFVPSNSSTGPSSTGRDNLETSGPPIVVSEHSNPEEDSGALITLTGLYMSPNHLVVSRD